MCVCVQLDLGCSNQDEGSRLPEIKRVELSSKGNGVRTSQGTIWRHSCVVQHGHQTFILCAECNVQFDHNNLHSIRASGLSVQASKLGQMCVVLLVLNKTAVLGTQ